MRECTNDKKEAGFSDKYDYVECRGQDMKLYDEIDQETIQMLVDTLIQRTQKGTLVWRDFEYGPILFLRGSRDEDESEPKILQTFELETDFNGTDCELKIDETISLPSGKGDIYVCIN